MSSPLVVIPAHNEEKSIAGVIQDLKKEGFCNILVVDDASTDNTYAVASEEALVISLPYNLGAWKATQTGIRYAYEQGIEQVITFDADGQHLASTLHPLLKFHQDNKCDIVIGSCVSRGSFARHIAWGMFRKLSGVEVRDLTSGLRVYNRRAMAVLSSEQATLLEYQDVGVLLLLKTFSVSKAEVKVLMSKRKDGISRIFYSWGAVAYYMAYTTMLCLSKIAKTHRFSMKESSSFLRD
ncbi:glycosyltransferase family 2 protein [Pseudoalteromonas sp. YIC-656]|uniref:glycosyltransferase family 2 protein n=1 Tax=Pseudoalteromonas pernae TaxID=3118054 RepID=UPI003241EC6C